MDLRAPALAALTWAGALAAAGWWWGASALTGVVVLVLVWRYRRDALALSLVGLTLAGTVAGTAALRDLSDTSSPLVALAEERRMVTADVVVLSDPRAVGQNHVLEVAAVAWRVRGHVAPEAAAQSGRTPMVVWGDARWQRPQVGEVWRASGRLARRDGTLWWFPTEDPTRVERADHAWRAAAAVRRGVRTAAGVPERPAAAPSLAPAASVTDAGAALVPALVDGDDAGLDESVKADFRTAGLTHLLAVSGTNLTVLLAFLLFVSRHVGVRGRWLVVVALAGVLGFVLLARGEPSVLRAAVMGSVGVLALGQRSAGRTLAVLSTCVVLLLLLDPGLGVQAGFGLSVCATAGIVVLAPGWSDLLAAQVERLPGARWLGWLPAAVVVPVAAQLACAPLVIALSGEVSLVAVVANLVAGPVVGPVTVLGLVGGVVAVGWDLAGQVISTPAVWGATWIVVVAERAAALPGASVEVGSTPAVWISALVASILLCLLVPRVLARARWVLASVAILGLVLWLPVPHPGWPPDGWVVAMCDVGQGDALLLRVGAGAAVMVDTGPDPALARRCLRRFGVEHIPLLLLTHHDADHVGGVAGVIDRVVAVETSTLAEPAAGAALVRSTAREHAPVTTATPGTRRIGQVTLQVLSVGVGAVDPNDSSVVALASVAGVRVLLTGDLGRLAQRPVERAVQGARVDVLKVPHHGSKDTDLTWLRELGAGIALIGVGADNTYGHPAPEVLDALADARVGRTDRDGDLAVVRRSGAWTLVHR